MAGSCRSELKLTIPMVVDDIEDTAAKAYSAMPDRLFILGPDGKIAYAGARGPRGFRPDEMEKALAKLVKPARKKG